RFLELLAFLRFGEGAISSRNFVAGRNVTVLLALILSGLPVCGLRPVRAGRLFKRKEPKPGKRKCSSSLIADVIVSKTRSAISVAASCVNSALVEPARIFLIKSVFVIGQSSLKS